MSAHSKEALDYWRAAERNYIAFDIPRVSQRSPNYRDELTALVAAAHRWAEQLRLTYSLP